MVTINDRIIKFKGKLVGEDKWVYSSSLNNTYDDNGEEKYYMYNKGSDSWKEVHKDSISQYIGYSDVNKQELYENDIILLSTPMIDSYDLSKEFHKSYRCLKYDIDKGLYTISMSEYDKDLQLFDPNSNFEVSGTLFESK